MTEIVALSPKVYSYYFHEYDEMMELLIKNKKLLKGVSKAVVDKDITHEIMLILYKLMIRLLGL